MVMKRKFSVEKIRVGKFLKEDGGSISLIVMALFMLTIITTAILTDISSVYLAKRSLTQATEAAAQRAVRNLDMDAYYRGEYNLTQSLRSLAGYGESDPGIPIDCNKGRADALSALADWSSANSSITEGSFGSNVSKSYYPKEIYLEKLSCDGYQIALTTASTTSLPCVLPFIGISNVRITSTVGTVDERKMTTNYYGIDIGNRTQ
jgi:hypothetical protein